MRDKQTCIRIRFYPSFLYFCLEKWLKKMSCKGWILFNCSFGIFYHFEKGIPKEREYFVWSPTARGEGKYSINLRYPFLRKRFGIKEKYSRLNKNSQKRHYNIIEIDPEQMDMCYKELKNDRNKLYLLYSIRNFFVLLFVFLLCVIIKFLEAIL